MLIRVDQHQQVHFESGVLGVDERLRRSTQSYTMKGLFSMVFQKSKGHPSLQITMSSQITAMVPGGYYKKHGSLKLWEHQRQIWRYFLVMYLIFYDPFKGRIILQVAKMLVTIPRSTKAFVMIPQLANGIAMIPQEQPQCFSKSGQCLQ